ncbi:MAG: putative ABC transporter permease [Lachnospiraceae bacterium]|nr:putative ABC transporter permease [Lachnospiraceae bacterium]
MYPYAWYHWLSFFYIYCFFGWIFESAYVSFEEKKFVNRGFLRIPMLPLYGTGAILMLWLCLPFESNPAMEYIVGVVGATALEYSTGVGMEMLFKVRYWDYSRKKFNLNGYICLSSSLAWGFLTLFMTDVIHHPIARFVLQLPVATEAWILVLISAAFLYDTIYATREALNLAKMLATITRLRAELDELQVKLALMKSEAAQNVDVFKENVKGTVSGSLAAYKAAQETKQEAKKESREALIAALSDGLNEKRELLQHYMSMHRPPILRRNPDAASRSFAKALKDLRTAWEARRSE